MLSQVTAPEFRPHAAGQRSGSHAGDRQLPRQAQYFLPPPLPDLPSPLVVLKPGLLAGFDVDVLWPDFPEPIPRFPAVPRPIFIVKFSNLCALHALRPGIALAAQLYFHAPRYLAVVYLLT